MKYAVYFGLGYLPDGNAVAVREQSIAAMMKLCNYTPCLIGIDNSVQACKYKRIDTDDYTMFLIHYASGIKDKTKELFTLHEVLIKICNEIGIDNIYAFIMQDHQFVPMYLMSRFCNKNGIVFIADIMDWIVPTKDESMYRNVFKTIDTFIRMKIFYKTLHRRILISHAFKDYFSNSKGINVVIPPVFCEKGEVIDSNNSSIKIVFAGNPGKHFEKEKLDWVLKSLYEIQGNIRLTIIGINRDETINNNPDLKKYITSKITFRGRLERKTCIEELKKSDFAIIIRKKTKLSEYGFSSKISEALFYGTPVIASNVGDNRLYIKNGENGFICEPNYDSLKDIIQRISNMQRKDIDKMKSEVKEANYFSFNSYMKEMRCVLAEG